MNAALVLFAILFIGQVNPSLNYMLLPPTQQAPTLVIPLKKPVKITPQSIQVSAVPQSPSLLSERQATPQTPILDNWHQIMKVDWYPSIWVWGHELSNGNIEWDQTIQADAWAKIGMSLPVATVPTVTYVPVTTWRSNWGYMPYSYSNAISGCAGGSCR